MSRRYYNNDLRRGYRSPLRDGSLKEEQKEQKQGNGKCSKDGDRDDDRQEEKRSRRNDEERRRAWRNDFDGNDRRGGRFSPKRREWRRNDWQGYLARRNNERNDHRYNRDKHSSQKNNNKEQHSIKLERNRNHSRDENQVDGPRQQDRGEPSSPSRNAVDQNELYMNTTEENGKFPYQRIDVDGAALIGDYKLLNVIGKGSVGFIYKAKNLETEDIVAVKIYKRWHWAEGELKILLFHGGIDHPNVMSMMDHSLGDEKHKSFIVMDLMPGDLSHFVDQHQENRTPIDMFLVKKIFLQLLLGLQYLHQKKIIHRDISTPNLLYDNDSATLKIADFGLSRYVDNGNITPNMATIHYRPPDILLGATKYSTEFDMWSAGCVLAELLQLDVLFDAESQPIVLNQQFQMLGTPTEETWPKVKELSGWQAYEFPLYPEGELYRRFGNREGLSKQGFDVLNGLLTMNPEKRYTAEFCIVHFWM